MNYYSQLVMLEDQLDVAQQFVQHLNINEIISQVAYIRDFDTLSNFILQENPNRIFWVDIHQGIGREDDGIRMIEIIRSACKDALIIVYTAYGDTKTRCTIAGADYFFTKGKNYENTMREISNIITNFLSNSVGSKIKQTEYIGEVAHIDEKDGWVKLECNINGLQVDKFFPLERISSSIYDEVIIDMIIKIRVIEIGNVIKMIFEQVEKDAKEKNNEGAVDANKLFASSIWTNKLK